MYLAPLSRGCRATAQATAIALLAVLTLAAPAAFAAPANDGYAHAKSLRLGKTIKGSVTGATRQADEPRHARSLATHSVWYRLRTKRKMTVAVNTCKTSFDTVLAVYTGRSVHSLQVVNYNNNGCNSNGGGSRVTFQALKGVTYRIAVVGFASTGRFRIGAYRLEVPPNDYFADAAAVTVGQSVDGTTLNATRELGEPPHTYNRIHTVWFKLSVAAPTTVEVLACTADGVTIYTGNSLRSLTRVTPTANVSCGEQFSAQPGVVYRIVVESGGNGLGYRLVTRAVPPGP
jgi:hypothetical protein